MFLGAEHSNEYFKKNKNELVVTDVEKIIYQEINYQVSCTEWDTVHVQKYLKSLQSISPNNLAKSLKSLRQYVSFICKQENIKPVPKFELESGRIYALIDYEKLLGVTLNHEQYIYIKNQISKSRDKVIFELAWLLLSVDDIKNLKETDIDFEISKETGWKIAHIKISETQTVTVEDPEVVQDIIDCMKEDTYLIDTQYKINKIMKFRPSEYLVKPVDVGRKGSDQRLSNPSLSLQNALIQQNINCPGININALNIENVRRSKIILLLAPQNENYYDRDMITSMLDAGNIESNLSWLQRVAKMKYTEK